MKTRKTKPGALQYRRGKHRTDAMLTAPKAEMEVAIDCVKSLNGSDQLDGVILKECLYITSCVRKREW